MEIKFERNKVLLNKDSNVKYISRFVNFDRKFVFERKFVNFDNLSTHDESFVLEIAFKDGSDKEYHLVDSKNKTVEIKSYNEVKKMIKTDSQKSDFAYKYFR